MASIPESCVDREMALEPKFQSICPASSAWELPISSCAFLGLWSFLVKICENFTISSYGNIVVQSKRRIKKECI